MTVPRVDDPDPWPDGDYECCPAICGAFQCTVPLGVEHPRDEDYPNGAHVASGLTHVCHVWDVIPNGQPS